MAGSANSLWTPDRDIPLHTKGVDVIRPEEMKTIADLHTIAQRLGLVLVCKACDHSFQGQNNGGGRTASIYCKCREIKADFGRSIIKI